MRKFSHYLPQSHLSVGSRRGDIGSVTNAYVHGHRNEGPSSIFLFSCTNPISFLTRSLPFGSLLERSKVKLSQKNFVARASKRTRRRKK